MERSVRQASRKEHGAIHRHGTIGDMDITGIMEATTTITVTSGPVLHLPLSYSPAGMIGMAGHITMTIAITITGRRIITVAVMYRMMHR